MKMLLLSAVLTLLAADSGPQQQDGRMMLTIFLRHDQSKTLDEINAHLDKTGFRQDFPPAGVEVVSWYVMMGIGQVRFQGRRRGRAEQEEMIRLRPLA
jgi:hypothetical protein